MSAARIMRVGPEEYFAAAALATAVLGTHRAPSGKKTKPSNQLKSAPGRREKWKKEEKFRRGILKKIHGRKRNFKPPVFHHFHSAADRRNYAELLTATIVSNHTAGGGFRHTSALILKKSGPFSEKKVTRYIQFKTDPRWLSLNSPLTAVAI